MTKSLDLSWLSRHDKELPMPELVFTNAEDYGGCYWHPEFTETLIGDRFIDRRNGIIEIGSVFDNAASVLAHEWRHHWQYCHGVDFDGPTWMALYDRVGDYWGAIERYFAESWTEFDALRFEITKHRNDVNDEWWGLMRDGRYSPIPRKATQQ